MKRRDDNRQLRPEEVEALENEESEEAGTFARASAEVLSQRRRIKIKRKSSTHGDTASFTAQPPGNPFANFSFTNGPPTMPAPSPFAGFSGLVSSTATSSTSVAEKKGPSSVSATSGFAGVNSSIAVNSGTAAVKVTPEMEKMQRLNKSFLDWMNRKKLQHGLSIWKDGLQDYINYAESIQNRRNVTSDGAVSATKQLSCDTSKNTKLPAFPPLSSTFSFQPMQSVDRTSKEEAPAASSSFSSSFSFSAPSGDVAKKVDGIAPPLVTSMFSTNFRKADEPSAPAFPDFTFNVPKNNTALSLAPPAVFSFNKPEAAAATGTEAGIDDDDEGEPILEPEVVHRNENDNDEILHEVDCKLFRFDKEQNEWKDAGKGKFRVTNDKSSGKKRILLRNLTGKIMLNAFFYPKMTFTKLGKNGIRFMLAMDGGSELKMLMIKTKVEVHDKTITFLQSCVPN